MSIQRWLLNVNVYSICIFDTTNDYEGRSSTTEIPLFEIRPLIPQKLFKRVRKLLFYWALKWARSPLINFINNNYCCNLDSISVLFADSMHSRANTDKIMQSVINSNGMFISLAQYFLRWIILMTPMQRNPPPFLTLG